MMAKNPPIQINPNLKAKTLDLGCGLFKLPGSIGVDIIPLEGVDVVHDLNQFPYPFQSNVFNYIRLFHVIEHVNSIVKTMAEVHRIAKSDCLVEIVTPHYTDISSWQDPSHQWHLNSRSFEHFETTSETNYYSNARFTIEFSEIKLLKLYKLLGFEFLVNLQNFSSHYRFFRKFWEQYLCTVVRGKVMTFKLRAIK